VLFPQAFCGFGPCNVSALPDLVLNRSRYSARPGSQALRAPPAL